MPKGLLIDFTLSNARRFYSSTGNPLGVTGLPGSKMSPLRVSLIHRPFHATVVAYSHKMGFSFAPTATQFNSDSMFYCFYTQIEKIWTESNNDYKDSNFGEPRNGATRERVCG